MTEGFAAGVMFFSTDSILLLRRVDNGMWSWPAGHIDNNETAQMAAIRECEEEIGRRPHEPRLHSKTGGFTLFTSKSDEFIPVLNHEHDAYIWAKKSDLPEPLYPGIRETLGVVAMDSARVTDINGYVTIPDNPIIREGVFPYLGRSIDPNGEDPDVKPDAVYNVYRPAEELSNPETIESFKMIPFIDEHAMLGPVDSGYMAPEKKGVHGITGEAVAFRDGIVYSNLRVFSQALLNLITGTNKKNELSLGYRCRFVKQVGVFAGKSYDFIQRSLIGNHLALVEKGRNNVSVLDATIVFDHFDINFETKENTMPTIEELTARVEALDSAMQELNTKNTKLQAALDEFEKKDDDKKAEDEDEEKKKDAEDESDEDKKDDKAEDESDDDKKKDEAMDAAINKKVAAMDAEIQTLKKGGIKALLAEVSKRDALAAKISKHVGTFDHADKTLEEVAAYGVEKLGLKCPKGHEITALDSFLHDRQVPGSAPAHFANNKVTASAGLDAYLKPTA